MKLGIDESISHNGEIYFGVRIAHGRFWWEFDVDDARLVIHEVTGIDLDHIIVRIGPLRRLP